MRKAMIDKGLRDDSLVERALPRGPQQQSCIMQSDASGMFAAMMIPILIGLVVFVFVAVCGWKVFVKAGHPGWAAIIPFYNLYIWLLIAGRPGWWLAVWLILSFIPFLSLATIVLGIIVAVDVCKAFGKSVGFMVLMILLPIVALPILAFGDAKYTKPVRA